MRRLIEVSEKVDFDFVAFMEFSILRCVVPDDWKVLNDFINKLEGFYAVKKVVVDYDVVEDSFMFKVRMKEDREVEKWIEDWVNGLDLRTVGVSVCIEKGGE
jgi:hypothetical protein